jgi:hypothetical protein
MKEKQERLIRETLNRDVVKEMLEDIKISRQFVGFMQEGSDLYEWHKGRLEYLEGILNITDTYK